MNDMSKLITITSLFIFLISFIGYAIDKDIFDRFLKSYATQRIHGTRIYVSQLTANNPLKFRYDDVIREGLNKKIKIIFPKIRTPMYVLKMNGIYYLVDPRNPMMPRPLIRRITDFEDLIMEYLLSKKPYKITKIEKGILNGFDVYNVSLSLPYGNFVFSITRDNLWLIRIEEKREDGSICRFMLYDTIEKLPSTEHIVLGPFNKPRKSLGQIYNSEIDTVLSKVRGIYSTLSITVSQFDHLSTIYLSGETTNGFPLTIIFFNSKGINASQMKALLEKQIRRISPFNYVLKYIKGYPIVFISSVSTDELNRIFAHLSE